MDIDNAMLFPVLLRNQRYIHAMTFTKKAPKLPYSVTFLMPLAFFITHSPQIFQHYNSLIVSVIAMFRIRLAGPWTATIHENITNKIIIPMVLNGIFQKPPK